MYNTVDLILNTPLLVVAVFRRTESSSRSGVDIRLGRQKLQFLRMDRYGLAGTVPLKYARGPCMEVIKLKHLALIRVAGAQTKTSCWEGIY